MGNNETREQLAGLRHALMRKIWSTPPVPEGLDTLVVAERILSDAELLDKLTAYRQAQRLIEPAPPRVIETLEDLESLPECTVVRWEAPDGLSRGVIERFDGAWWSPGHHARLLPERISLPATVLWEPKEARR